jgi:hypothetical protein
MHSARPRFADRHNSIRCSWSERETAGSSPLLRLGERRLGGVSTPRASSRVTPRNAPRARWGGSCAALARSDPGASASPPRTRFAARKTASKWAGG